MKQEQRRGLQQEQQTITKNDIVTLDKTPLTIIGNMPADLIPEGREALGKDNLDRFEMAIIGLCQTGTPQRLKVDPLYIPGLEEGMFFNTVTGKIYGSEIFVIPLKYFNDRARWDKTPGSKTILCRSFDHKFGIGDPGGDCKTCEFSQFKKEPDATGSKRPDCNDQLNFIVFVLDDRQTFSPIDFGLMRFKSKGIKHAEHWTGLIKHRDPRSDIFDGVYRVTTFPQTNGVQNWIGKKVDNAEWINKAWKPVLHDAFKVMAASGTEISGIGETPDLDEPGSGSDKPPF